MMRFTLPSTAVSEEGPDLLFVEAGGTLYGGRTARYEWERDTEDPDDLAKLGLVELEDGTLEERQVSR
jgi:hypothetical protein